MVFKNPYESLGQARKRIGEIDFQIPKLMQERAECKQRISYLLREIETKTQTKGDEQNDNTLQEDII